MQNVAIIFFIVFCLLLLLMVFTRTVTNKIRRGFPPPGKFIDIEGLRLHYVEQGAGPAIVMIHGLNGQLRHFTYALAALVATRCKVILLDRPGAGHSSARADGQAGLRSQAALVAAFIAALGLDRPLLVGHSLGGAVALAVALDHPDAISGLALVAPLTQVQTDVPPAFKALGIASPALRWLYSRLFLMPMAIRHRKATLAMVFGPEAAPADFPTAAGGLLSLRPETYLAACADLRGVADDLPALVARYGDIRMPVSVLFGRQDRILDWQRHGECLRAQVPQVRLETVDGGHMLPLTQPQTTAAFIESAVRVRGRQDPSNRYQPC